MMMMKHAGAGAFADRMAMLDALELGNGERPGGPVEAVAKLERSLEAEILATRSATTEERRWKVERLARAVENEWSTVALRPLLASIELDSAVPA